MKCTYALLESITVSKIAAIGGRSVHVFEKFSDLACHVGEHLFRSEACVVGLANHSGLAFQLVVWAQSDYISATGRRLHLVENRAPWPIWWSSHTDAVAANGAQ